MDRYIFIIGSMKSGTTTVFDLLARHPRISAARIKEPGFFAFEEVRERGDEWYRSLFDFDPARHDYRMEGSTDYTKWPFSGPVWDRMKSSGIARPKLIFIMRHPLRRIESHARHVQTTCKELGQRVSPRLDHGLDQGVSLVSLAAAQYASQLDRFAEARENGDLFLLTLEELKSAPGRVVPALFDFLGLDAGEMSAEIPVSNTADHKVRTAGAWQAVAKSRALMGLGKAVLPKSARDAIKRLFVRKVRVEGRFTLLPEEEEALLDLLRPDLRRLRDEYGVDVERHWGPGLL